MRIRTRRNLKKKNVAIVFLFLLPLIGFLSYASGILIMLEDETSYTFDIDPPNTERFYSMDEIDENKMAELAEVISERLLLYHLPINLSVTTEFTDYNYDTVERYHETDNAALYGSQTLAAQCLRYATAKKENDQAEMDASMKIIRKLVKGFSLLMAVPNGGLGPEYPGTPGRFYAPPGSQADYPEMWSDHYKMFYGQGKYSGWRCRLFTSLDEMGGYALAIGSVFKFIDPSDSEDANWCYNTMRLVIAQLIEGFKDTNWLVLHGDGSPAGSDLNMDFGGGAWKLTFLKLGAIAYPEMYTSDYAYTYAKALHSSQAGEGSSTNTIMEYYAYNFGMSLVYSLIINEENPNIKQHYINLYANGFYDILKYHRNAWINAAFLAFMTMVDNPKSFENSAYTFEEVKWDVNDQMYRFYFWANPTGMSLPKDKWGIRDYNLEQRPHSTRATSTNPDIAKMEIYPTSAKWRDYLENDYIGKSYAWVKDSLIDFNDHYYYPITVSEANPGAMVFAGNPFYGNGNRHAESGDGLHEERGNDFMLPYYIGRYYGFIDGPSI